jgi:hypothetical protein
MWKYDHPTVTNASAQKNYFITVFIVPNFTLTVFHITKLLQSQLWSNFEVTCGTPPPLLRAILTTQYGLKVSTHYILKT